MKARVEYFRLPQSHTPRSWGMDVISFKLPPALNQRLETYATKRKMTKSEVIRLALNEYLAKEGV